VASRQFCREGRYVHQPCRPGPGHPLGNPAAGGVPSRRPGLPRPAGAPRPDARHDHPPGTRRRGALLRAAGGRPELVPHAPARRWVRQLFFPPLPAGERREKAGAMFDFNFLFTAILIVAVLGALLGLCAYLTLAERKVCAWMQDRLGPNRVGPWGLFQPLADGGKFLLKEDIIPGHVDRVFYLLAPAIAMGTALFAFAVVPFGPTAPRPALVDYRAEVDPAEWAQEKSAVPKAPEERARAYPVGPVWPQSKLEEAEVLAADAAHARNTGQPTYQDRVAGYNRSWNFVIAPRVDVGFVLVFAVGSLAVYGVILGGWSSNSKYSLLGGLRSSAQLISYEIPMGLAVLGVVLMAGSLNLERIIDRQVHQDGWYILYQ